MCLCEEFSASCVSNNALRASKRTSLASGLTLNDIQMSCVDHIGGKKRCKKRPCLSLSIFTLGLIWVRTKDERRRALCQDPLGVAKGAAASTWGRKVQFQVQPSTIFLT